MNAFLDESSEPLGEYEYPDVHEDDDDPSSHTVECPECGESIYDDAEQCPFCGQYVTIDTRSLAGRPFWYVALALLGIAATIAALSRLY